MKKNIFDFSLSLLLMLAGSIIGGLAYSAFLIPYQINPGGLSGVAMLLNYLLGTPVGLLTIVMNIPLFVIGVRLFGAVYGIKSVAGMVMFSVMIDFFTYLVPLKPPTENLLLAAIFGGLLVGIGIGLVFRGGGSTGGTDIIGQIISHYTNFSTGTAILFTDGMIICAAGLVLGNIEILLYALVNIYLQTQAIDLVLEGASYTRAMFVISDHAEKISRLITSNLSRGATLFHATGAYTDKRRDVVFSVMSKREVSRARFLIKQQDPRAFVIITDVYEVLGEGFRPRLSNTPQ
jgi:uncharacterized membrane-anchored protein YitT (DUF2179 family)